MARGWESKSVEAQQADREDRGQAPVRRSLEEEARDAQRQTLELSKRRAQADLVAATNPAHRRMLEAAILAIDEQLQRDERGSTS